MPAYYVAEGGIVSVSKLLLAGRAVLMDLAMHERTLLCEFKGGCDEHDR